MSIDAYGAKVTRRDVQDLAIASDQLAVAADTIRRMRPSWGEAVVNLLIAANLTITRVQNRGATAFARYIAKHGPQAAQDAPGEASASSQSATSDRTPPEGAER